MREKYPDFYFSSESVRKQYKRLLSKDNSIVISKDGLEVDNICFRKYPQVKDDIDEIYNEYKDIDRVLVLSDLHVPYQDMKWIREQLSIAKEWGVRLVVLAGDIQDEGKFSSFEKSRVPYKAEHGMTKTLIGEISNEFEVVMIRGNHDIRLMSYLSKATNSEEFSFLFEGQEIDPLAVIARETGISYVPHWWVQIGPVIYAHPSRYSNVELKNIVNTIDYFVYRNRDRYWDTVVQGHSHKTNAGVIRGIQYFETGCSCTEIDYNYGPKQTAPVWTQGAVYLRIEDGKLLFNKSKLVTGRTLL